MSLLLLQKNNNTLSLPAYCWSFPSFSSLASSYTTFILGWSQNLTLKCTAGKFCEPKCFQNVLLLLMTAWAVILAVCSRTINTERGCLTAIFMGLLMPSNFTMSVPLEHTCSLLLLLIVNSSICWFFVHCTWIIWNLLHRLYVKLVVMLW